MASTLAEDCDCLDGVVAVGDEDEGDTIRINGWLWSIEVIGEGTVHA